MMRIRVTLLDSTSSRGWLVWIREFVSLFLFLFQKIEAILASIYEFIYIYYSTSGFFCPAKTTALFYPRINAN